MTAATVTQLPVTQAPREGGQAVRPIIPRTYQEVAQMAQATCRAGIARKYDNDPSKVAAVMMSGMELGLKPLSALRLFWISPEGQPALSARGQLAVVQGSGLLESWEDRFDGEGDARAAIIAVRRRGLPGIVRRFSMADAKKAGLLSKQNWSKYGDRMLWNRAVSFALNDQFADILGGIYDPSELGGPVLDDNGAEIEPPRIEAPKVAQIEVIMTCDEDPLYYDKTKRGIQDALDELGRAVLDGGAGCVLLNVELLDWMSKPEIGFADQVAALRDTARAALTPSGDDTADADEAPDQAELGG